MPGTLFVVATPIGNLEDITLRALRVLRDVSVIAAEDTRRTAQLLARHAITTPTTSLHEHNEGRKSAMIVARLLAGENVALVSDAGSPTVSDPGAHLIREAMVQGVRVEPVPGPSAVIAALTVSGMRSDSFAFLGFPPIKAKARKQWFRHLCQIGGTAVFFEAPHRVRQTLSELRTVAGDVTVLIGRELTKIHEELVKGPISAILGRLDDPKGEFTIVTNIGLMTENKPGAADHQSESRRQALASLAKAYGVSANALYQAISNAKKSAN